MSSNVEKYTRVGLNVASTATSLGFAGARLGTKLGFSIARGITSTTLGVVGSAFDYTILGGAPVVGPALGGTVSFAIDFAEKVALAPIVLGETIASTSLVAAGSSIDVMTAMFPGSDEASFSLGSFLSLVKREWNEPVLGEHLPEERYPVTKISKALIAWVALQSVTNEWQEGRLFETLQELEVQKSRSLSPTQEAPVKDAQSEVHITSDAVLQDDTHLCTADIGEALQQKRISSQTDRRPLTLLETTKSDLRRFSKLVLAGYGGASLIFFGVPISSQSIGVDTTKVAESEEAATLIGAVEASETEAHSTASRPAETRLPETPPKSLSWWDTLLGKHDRDIIEIYANQFEPVPTHSSTMSNERHVPTTVFLGKEKMMPRYWVLTDHARKQIVLVFRGTMSLNELAVDLTCDPSPFVPGRTLKREEDYDTDLDGDGFLDGLMPGAFPPSARPAQLPQELETDEDEFYVHGGMLRMARVMGGKGKPLHKAVRHALRRNKGYELILCGHSLGAGVAALLALTWSDPRTCVTTQRSGFPPGRRVHAFCFAPPFWARCLISRNLSKLSYDLITSFTYSYDIVTRLSLGSVRDMNRAALWLCKANDSDMEGRRSDGYNAVTLRALKYKTGLGEEGDKDWFLSIRKTLEANMCMADLFPAGRVLWATYNDDLHPSHQVSGPQSNNFLRLFEVTDVEKMFGQMIFSKDMLSSHLPHTYDHVLHEVL